VKNFSLSFRIFLKGKFPEIPKPKSENFQEKNFNEITESENIPKTLSSKK